MRLPSSAADPQRLNAVVKKQSSYRSGELLRHPKSWGECLDASLGRLDV